MIDTDECQICIDWEQPCDACAKEIHQSWHDIGWWWIRPEECDVTCPASDETLAWRLSVVEISPRDRARDKQLRKTDGGYDLNGNGIL